VGKYDLEVLTLPRIYLNDVEIKQSSTNTIKIPTSGNVFFSRQNLGNGSVYLDDGKKVVWVCNLNPALQNEIIYLQPGKYKVVFRYQFEKQTTKTIERNFEVKSGLQQTVKLF
jgi:Ca-activated chloride channel homolog